MADFPQGDGPGTEEGRGSDKGVCVPPQLPKTQCHPTLGKGSLKIVQDVYITKFFTVRN